MHFIECENYEILNALAATTENLKDSGCVINAVYGLFQDKNICYLLSEGKCGGRIGEAYLVAL